MGSAASRPGSYQDDGADGAPHLPNHLDRDPRPGPSPDIRERVLTRSSPAPGHAWIRADVGRRLRSAHLDGGTAGAGGPGFKALPPSTSWQRGPGGGLVLQRPLEL